MVHSIVEYYAEHDRYRCGYCKSPDTNYSHGMWAHRMTVFDYQDLIDRGWRRSGKYCYKPTMHQTCCPMYTIRCRAPEFKATKSQKKILKHFNKYLSGQELEPRKEPSERKMSTCSSEADEEPGGQGGDMYVRPVREHKAVNVGDVELQQLMEDDVKELETEVKKDSNSIDIAENKDEDGKLAAKPVKKGVGLDETKGPCKKAKQLRLERKLEKLRSKGVVVDSVQTNCKNKEKQLEDFINELPEELQHKLEIKLVRTSPPSPEWLASAKESHVVYTSYQMVVHGDSKDKCSEPKFTDFLVSSPLEEEYSETGPPSGYGSFHQQYWLDSRLIAVGVIDILPKCVSSVYFFYDPNYMNLSLGTYGALREIAFTRQLHSTCPELKYYYMGFYIHSCKKMLYKGNFAPSDLLCPETYKWFPIKDCIPKLEVSPYSRLNPDIDDIDTNDCTERNLNDIPVLLGSSIVTYKFYKRKQKIRNDETVLEYAKLVGAKCAKSLILARF